MNQLLTELPPKKVDIVYIYFLKHPVPKKIRYVGKTNDPSRRYWDHLKSRINNPKKNKWIESILKQKKLPEMEIFKEVSKDNWQEEELKVIEDLKSQGHILFNIQKGIENKLPDDIKKNFELGTYFRLDTNPINVVIEFPDGSKWLLDRANDYSKKEQEVKYFYLLQKKYEFKYVKYHVPKSVGRLYGKPLIDLEILDHGYLKGKKFYPNAITGSISTKILDARFKVEYLSEKSRQMRIGGNLSSNEIITIIEDRLLGNDLIY